MILAATAAAEGLLTSQLRWLETRRGANRGSLFLGPQNRSQPRRFKLTALEDKAMI